VQTKATFHQYYDIRNEAFHINKRAVNYFLDFSFLSGLFGGTLLYIIGGGTAFLQQNIWGTAFPLHYITADKCL